MINNTKGSAILNALIVSLGISAIGMYLTQEAVNTIKALHVPRIKSLMAVVENQVRLNALLTSSYDCSSSLANQNARCVLSGEYINFQTLSRYPIPTCTPVQTAPLVCGVIVENSNIDQTTQIFTATVRYNGTDVSIRPVNISMRIPVELLQEDTFECPDTAPILKGFITNPNSDFRGKPNCAPIPSNLCPQGRYVTGIDVSTLQVQCGGSLGPPINCGGNLLTNLRYNQGFTANCSTARPNPFTFYTPVPEPMVTN